MKIIIFFSILALTLAKVDFKVNCLVGLNGYAYDLTYLKNKNGYEVPVDFTRNLYFNLCDRLERSCHE